MNGRARVLVVALAAALVAAATGPALAAPAPSGSAGPAGSLAGDRAAVGAAASDATGVSNDAAASQHCEYPLEVTDASGSTVEIDEEPRSVVTLGPSAAQTMVEIGAWEKVVGVTQFAAYLDGAEDRANVSAPGFGNYDVERIVTLTPDVVLAANIIDNETVEQMRSVGLTVVRFEAASSIDDVRAKTELMGRIVGACEGAEAATAWIDANLAAVSSAVEDRDRPKSVYVLGSFTAGSDTFVDDMIGTAGATNVMAEAGISGFKPLDEEVVATENPSWVIVNNPASDVLNRSPYASTTAGEEGNLLVVNPNWINQPAPRSVVFAVRNMTEAFHPGAYGPEDYVSREEAAAGPTPTPTTNPTPTPTPTPTTTAGDGTTTSMDGDGTGSTTSMDDDETGATDATTDPGSGGATPGFTAGAALVAVLVALLVRRRRD